MYEDNNWHDDLRRAVAEAVGRVNAAFLRESDGEDDFNRNKRALRMMKLIHERKPYDSDIRAVFGEMRKKIKDKMSQYRSVFIQTFEEEKYEESADEQKKFMKLAKLYQEVCTGVNSKEDA